MKTVFVLEERYFAYCGCKISKLSQEGHLYKYEYDGGVEYFYSPVSKPWEQLEDDFESGRLEKITTLTDRAIELGIATEHWKVLAVYNPETTFVPGGKRLIAYQVGEL